MALFLSIMWFKSFFLLAFYYYKQHSIDYVNANDFLDIFFFYEHI